MPDIEPVPDMHPVATLPETARSPRVLVIEDDRHVRSLLCDLLEMWGYATDAAGDGHDGLRRLAEARYDAVVTDFKMPGISGLTVAERARESAPGTPVIIVTAYAGDLEAHRARLGFAVLQKPVDFEHLRRVVGDAVARSASPP
ncbi:MAG TPA: response regulator [Candidatus Tectomicrobia bacterium]|nr:response regulator [Candidatus Tectomicrobia bacterium]